MSRVLAISPLPLQRLEIATTVRLLASRHEIVTGMDVYRNAVAIFFAALTDRSVARVRELNRGHRYEMVDCPNPVALHLAGWAQ